MTVAPTRRPGELELEGSPGIPVNVRNHRVPMNLNLRSSRLAALPGPSRVAASKPEPEPRPLESLRPGVPVGATVPVTTEAQTEFRIARQPELIPGLSN